MGVQAITLNLPRTVYRRIQRAAEKARRPVDEVLVEAVTAVAPVMDTASEKLRTALAQMAYLNDAALWQTARATMPARQRKRLEALHHQQQRQRLTAREQAEEQTLLALYRETLLVRAQAAVLLKQRGYDISDPQTDWQRLEAMTDEEIDYSDIPPLDDDFFARATLRLPDQPKVIVTSRGHSHAGPQVKRARRLSGAWHVEGGTLQRIGTEAEGSALTQTIRFCKAKAPGQPGAFGTVRIPLPDKHQ